MMREMASRDIFDHKPGSMEKGAISQNIADNLKNFEEIVVTKSSCLQIYLIFFLQNAQENNCEEVSNFINYSSTAFVMLMKSTS